MNSSFQSIILETPRVHNPTLISCRPIRTSPPTSIPLFTDKHCRSSSQPLEYLCRRVQSLTSACLRSSRRLTPSSSSGSREAAAASSLPCSLVAAIRIRCDAVAFYGEIMKEVTSIWRTLLRRWRRRRRRKRENYRRRRGGISMRRKMKRIKELDVFQQKRPSEVSPVEASPRSTYAARPTRRPCSLFASPQPPRPSDDAASQQSASAQRSRPSHAPRAR